MSLDVYLEGEPETKLCTCRDCFNEHTTTGRQSLYWSNITHNLTEMADAAGIYQALWRPDENEITKANQLIPILESGLAKLKADPEKFRKYNSPNGWGTYKHFVPFVEKYLEACREYPNANVRVSR